MTSMQQKLRFNQTGMASFIVVASLMLVLSLMVLSFSKIVRNDQRQTLDRQLSSRAFYAAESGVNLAREALSSGAYSTGKTECSDTGAINASDYQVDSANGTSITCLTIDTSPTTLQRDISNGGSWVVPLNGLGQVLGGLIFSWQGSNPGSYNCANSTSGFPAAPTWNCGAPLLRVDVVPVTGSMNVNSLSDTLRTFYLYPTNNPGAGSLSLPVANNQNGAIGSARCAVSLTPQDCNITVSGFTQSNYYARITSLYGNARVSLTTSNNVALQGAQAIVDSTGRSVDVLRRIQVRLPLTDTTGVPGYAIFGAAGICKRYTVVPGVASPIGYDPAALASDSTCTPN